MLIVYIVLFFINAWLLQNAYLHLAPIFSFPVLGYAELVGLLILIKMTKEILFSCYADILVYMNWDFNQKLVIAIVQTLMLAIGCLFIRLI